MTGPKLGNFYVLIFGLVSCIALVNLLLGKEKAVHSLEHPTHDTHDFASVTIFKTQRGIEGTESTEDVKILEEDIKLPSNFRPCFNRHTYRENSHGIYFHFWTERNSKGTIEVSVNKDFSGVRKVTANYLDPKHNKSKNKKVFAQEIEFEQLGDELVIQMPSKEDMLRTGTTAHIDDVCSPSQAYLYVYGYPYSIRLDVSHRDRRSREYAEKFGPPPKKQKRAVCNISLGMRLASMKILSEEDLTRYKVKDFSQLDFDWNDPTLNENESHYDFPPHQNPLLYFDEPVVIGGEPHHVPEVGHIYSEEDGRVGRHMSWYPPNFNDYCTDETKEVRDALGQLIYSLRIKVGGEIKLSNSNNATCTIYPVGNSFSNGARVTFPDGTESTISAEFGRVKENICYMDIFKENIKDEQIWFDEDTGREIERKTMQNGRLMKKEAVSF